MLQQAAHSKTSFLLSKPPTSTLKSRKMDFNGKPNQFQQFNRPAAPAMKPVYHEHEDYHMSYSHEKLEQKQPDIKPRESTNSGKPQEPELWYCCICLKHGWNGDYMPGPWNIVLVANCITCGHERCNSCEVRKNDNVTEHTIIIEDPKEKNNA
ncbi:hypothetical protein DFH27DRAFT_526416 [Peziza echinospora]|nr:hypothetical protein DFH27DRAFT_526416 [Peziza echinospora]